MKFNLSWCETATYSAEIEAESEEEARELFFEGEVSSGVFLSVLSVGDEYQDGTLMISEVD